MILQRNQAKHQNPTLFLHREERKMVCCLKFIFLPNGFLLTDCSQEKGPKLLGWFEKKIPCTSWSFFHLKLCGPACEFACGGWFYTGYGTNYNVEVVPISMLIVNVVKYTCIHQLCLAVKETKQLNRIAAKSSIQQIKV